MITELLIIRRQEIRGIEVSRLMKRERFEDATLLTLKMEREAMSQGMQLYELKRMRKEVFPLLRQQVPNGIAFAKPHVNPVDS